MEKFKKIVLNIPHSAVLNGVFDKELGGWGYNYHFINESLLEHCDLFTDFLFSYDNPKVVNKIANLSRFVVDMERLENDPLEKVGQGIVYTEYDSFKRRDLSVEEREELMSLWRVYNTELLKEVFPNNLLIDCHSFSSRIASGIDVCIGLNNDFSRPSDETIKHIVSLFEKSGYKVEINNPFSNSITPFNGIKGGYKSFMVEVNKKTYMDEETHTIKGDTSHAPRMRKTLLELYDSLLE
jgi:N-formylglutamate amidohydrolase